MKEKKPGTLLFRVFRLYLHDALYTISRFTLGVCTFARLHLIGLPIKLKII